MNNNNNNNNKNITVIIKKLLFVSLFLIRIPPLYLLPIANSFLLSSNISRILIALSAVLILFTTPKKYKYTFLDYVIIAFFFSQSISSINSSNIYNFILVYKNISFSILLYFIVKNLFDDNDKRIIILILIVSGVINVSLQLLLYISPSLVEHYVKPFIYDNYWQYIQYNLLRNRYIGDTFEEILIPCIFWYFFVFNKKSYSILIASSVTCAIVFITLISGWRTKFILLLLSMGASIVLYNDYIRKKIVYILFILFIFYCFGFAMLSINNKSMYTVDRFFYDDTFQKKSTLESRFDYWSEALSLGIKNPLLGVGLGNYYDNLSSISKNNKQGSINGYKTFIYIDDPHNIFIGTFAYSGLFGLALMTILIIIFLRIDIGLFKQKDLYLRSIIISFWSLFFFSLLNPSVNYSYEAFFWFLRALIDSKKNS